MTGTNNQPVHVIVGPDRHGVVLHALEVIGDAPRERIAHFGDVRYTPGAVHLHFTDNLFGPDAARAADCVTDHFDHYSVTFHDVPSHLDAAQDAARYDRRARAYARVATRAQLAVCNSDAEANWLKAVLAHAQLPAPHIAVIGLPLAQPAPARPPRTTISGQLTIGVMGFIYPGKGHDTVIDASPPGSRVLCLGACSDGHADLAGALQRRGADRGVDVEITGFISDDALATELARPDVPVVAHAHMSASGSLGSWLAAGRKPLALNHAFVAETLAVNPGMATLVPGAAGAESIEALRDAIAAACENPSDTWLSAGTRLRPDIADVRRAYATLLAGRP